MNEIKAIETEYNGYKFRSRLEARWAVFFNELGIDYEYEPEGFEFEDGTKYLPDFYLLKHKQFFEVKGCMDDFDQHKIELLCEAGYKVTIGYDNFEFEDSYDYCGEVIGFADKEDSYLVKCNKCGQYYFTNEYGDWACRCCEFYNSDNTFNVEILRGNSNSNKTIGDKKIREALKYAKQVRFRDYLNWNQTKHDAHYLNTLIIRDTAKEAKHEDVPDGELPKGNPDIVCPTCGIKSKSVPFTPMYCWFCGQKLKYDITHAKQREFTVDVYCDSAYCRKEYVATEKIIASDYSKMLNILNEKYVDTEYKKYTYHYIAENPCVI